ncbi:MAG: hypothetical protein QOG99_2763 [Frankiales bacterium]|nr:hypothetical protein [Frankiales bacterium]
MTQTAAAMTAMTSEPPLARRRALFVSWISHHARSEQLADALGAECVFIAVGTLRNRRTTVFRHFWQAVLTLRLLLRRRPRVLIVMAPPAPLLLLALVWSRLTRSKLVADCHSGAVIGRPLSARLAARTDLVIVTLPQLTTGFPRAVPVHDPLVRVPSAPRHDEIVFPASWEVDEPVHALLDAARALPDQAFAITGRPTAGLDVPPNVRLTGFLSRVEYLALLAGAPVVLALTTEEDTMQQAGYEAMAAGRPVVASDTRALRSYLGDAAVYSEATASGLTAAVTGALARLPELERAAALVREQQRAEFARVLAEIGERLT